MSTESQKRADGRVRSSELLDALVAAVNGARYRGPDGRGPMTDRYGWPMCYDEADAITWAALRYVVEIESASNGESSNPARTEQTKGKHDE